MAAIVWGVWASLLRNLASVVARLEPYSPRELAGVDSLNLDEMLSTRAGRHSRGLRSPYSVGEAVRLPGKGGRPSWKVLGHIRQKGLGMTKRHSRKRGRTRPAYDARLLREAMMWVLRVNRPLHLGLRDQAIWTLNNSYGLSGRDLARLSGLTEASVSRIANRKQQGWGSIKRQTW